MSSTTAFRLRLRLFDRTNYLVLTLVALACLFPLLHVLAVSLSDRAAVDGHKVFLWPIGFNTANYKQIFQDPLFLHAIQVSGIRVLLGTAINLAVIVLTAYPLSLVKSFPGRRSFTWLLIFTMLFNGGLIPLYLVIRNLHMLDTMWSLVLPTAVNAFFIIVMANFFRNIPRELSEAAMIDGASHWRILTRIYLPLSLPGLVTLGLFSAVFHWNSWFDGLIYMSQTSNYPLQSYLQTFLQNTGSQLQTDPSVSSLLSDQGLQSAQILVATVPILLVYPFLQRYFVAGLTLGAVKE